MADIFQVLWLSLLAGVLFVPPGYVLGFAFNLFGFRDEGLLGRVLRAIPLSIATVPIELYLADRFTGQRLGLGIFTTFWALMTLTLLLEMHRWPAFIRGLRVSLGENRRWLALPLGWLFWCALALADITWGGVLYNSLLCYDYAKNVAVTDALFRTGIPPINPSFYPGEPISLFYYYFWFLFPANLANLVGGTASLLNIVNACTLWPTLGLFSLIGLWLRYNDLTWSRRPGLAWLTVALLFVTGLDLIPVLYQGLVGDLVMSGKTWVGCLEWWEDQVSSWLGHALWTPHHMAGFVACLTAMLCWRFGQEQHLSWRQRLPYHLVAGLCLASAVGLSVWVTLMAGVLTFTWAICCLRRGLYGEFIGIALSGLLALALASPYLRDLSQANRQPGSSPLAFEVRMFRPTAWLLVGRNVPYLGFLLTKLASLPLYYFMEWGFFFLTTVTYLRDRRRRGQPLTDGELFLHVTFWTSLIVSTFVRSALKNNDFGWRGHMFAQFVMLLWAASVCSRMKDDNHDPDIIEIGPLRKAVIVVFLVVGFAGNVFDLVSTHVSLHNLAFTDRSANYFDANSTALREAYIWLRDHSERNAITQHRPIPPKVPDAEQAAFAQTFDVEIYHAIYGNRQVVLADEHYAKLYGINTLLYETWSRKIAELFTKKADWPTIVAEAKTLRIDWLVIRSDDAAWADKSGWTWSTEPAFKNDHVRIFQVGKTKSEPRP